MGELAFLDEVLGLCFSRPRQCEMVDRVDLLLLLLLLLLNILFISFVQGVFVLFVCVSFQPDTTVMVDWVLKLA